MRNFGQPTRRHFMTTAATGMALAGLSGARPAAAQTAVNWKKFAGTTIEVNLIKSPRGDTLQKYEKEFEELTGIKVNSEQTPEQQQRQKTTIELSSGKPSFDVVHISYHVREGRLAGRPVGHDRRSRHDAAFLLGRFRRGRQDLRP
jgi:multiple sugar transport system substrate-binding protein